MLNVQALNPQGCDSLDRATSKLGWVPGSSLGSPRSSVLGQWPLILPAWEGVQGPVFFGTLNGGCNNVKIPDGLVLLLAYDAQRPRD